MPTYNGKPYSSTKNLNVNGGLIRFGRTHSTNPFGSTENGLYVNSSNRLIYSRQGVEADVTVTSASLSPSKSPSISPSASPS